MVLLFASVDETLICDHSFNLDLFIMLYKEILRTDNNFFFFWGRGGECESFIPLRAGYFIVSLHCVQYFFSSAKGLRNFLVFT